MAPEPAKSSQGKKGTKRSVPDPAEKPALKKFKLPWPPEASSPPEKAPLSISEQALQRAQKESPDWQNMEERDRIDAISVARDELQAEASLRCPTKIVKLDLQLDITPRDAKWIAWSTTFETELLQGSVKEVLDKYFTEGQTLAILPPGTQGTILDIQKTEAKEYEELLAGQLKGVKDNLVTKLTMLHFGLAVAPMTLNNVLNAGKDEDDLPDLPPSLPRVQRIQFAEKPLEFLDLYHERSHGFPMLRRPKSKVHQQSPLTSPYESTQIIETTDAELTGDHLPVSIFPTGTKVGLRGGAGDQVIVYGLNNLGLEITLERENSEGYFLEAALRILSVPKGATAYAFVVEQYRNQEKNKNEPDKAHVKSFPVDQSNFSHTYNQYLKARLYNRQRDWVLVVRPTSGQTTATFRTPDNMKKPALRKPATISGDSTNTGPILPPPKKSPVKPKNPPSPPKSPTKPTPSKKDPLHPTITYPKLPHEPGGLPGASPTAAMPSSDERVVYSLDGRTSAVFKHDHKSFYAAALKVVKQGGLGQPKVNFTVSQSNNAPARQAPAGKFEYVGSVKYPAGSANLPQYNRTVASVMFKEKAAANYHKAYRIVAHPTTPQVVQYWPQTRDSDGMVNVLFPITPVGPAGGAPTGTKPPGAGAGPSPGAGPAPPAHKPTPRTGYIHGFGGRFLVNNTAEDFQRAALQLLGISPTSVYHFFVYSPESRLPKSVVVHHNSFAQKFESDVRPFMPDTGPWNIFVSKYRLLNGTSLEPENDKKDIVKITYENDVAYWKIPRDTKTVYGINQLQEEFARAMRVLFPLGAPGDVAIGAEGLDFTPIRFGGLELTKELWLRVVGDLENQSGALSYTINLTEKSPEFIGIRLIGRPESALANSTDYAEILLKITDLQGRWQQQNNSPKQFRLWKTAEDRESNRNSILINYEPAATAEKEIEKFLTTNPATKINCLWFRPEFSTFFFTNAGGVEAKFGEKEEVTGNTLTATLSALSKVFDESNPKNIKNTVILDIHAENRFFLWEGITACQFRKYVSDWFTGQDIHVRSNEELPYQIEQMPPWGLLEPMPVAPASQNKPPTVSTLPSNSLTNTRPPPPRINKERLLKDKVALPPAVEWNVWSTENNRQDRLQRDSYWKDQSVIEPGQLPAPPIYGPPRQTPLSTGSTMNLPDIYCWPLTPSDFARKAAEAQALRNSCLERMSRCQLCDTTFPEYEVEKIAEHLRSHQDALREVGKCPFCGCCWAALDKQQRKEHLWGHQKQEESDLMRNYWQGHECPVCNEDLNSLPSNDDILAHMLEHPRGILRFCDRCGLDEKMCDDEEKLQHRRTCFESTQAVKAVFCNRCGKDKSSETEQDRQAHDSICTPNGKDFCTVCGLDRTHMRDDAKHQHCIFHKAPGGTRKTYCKRCGNNLVTMNANEQKAHQADCYLMEPYTMETRERLQELENRIAEDKVLKAHNNAENARLVQKRAELNARESAIKGKEAALGIQAPESIARPTDLPDAFNCPLLKPDGSVCNQRIVITACGGQIKAHYQHNCVPGVDNCGGIPGQIKVPLGAGFDMQELIKLYPIFKAGSDRMQREADRIRARKANAEQTEGTEPTQEGLNAGGKPIEDPNDTTSQTVTPAPETNPNSPKKSPTKPSYETNKPGSDAGPPETEEENLNKPPTDATGFDRRRKAAPSARKTSAKTPAKRKKAMVEDENAVGGYPELMTAKTPRGGKRQKTTMARAPSLELDSSVLGSDSGEEEPLAPPVGVRRTTRATSGTPGPSLALPVARRAGRPKARAGDAQLDEEDEEEEAEVMRSPAKRGRPQSPRKR